MLLPNTAALVGELLIEQEQDIAVRDGVVHLQEGAVKVYLKDSRQTAWLLLLHRNLQNCSLPILLSP